VTGGGTEIGPEIGGAIILARAVEGVATADFLFTRTAGHWTGERLFTDGGHVRPQRAAGHQDQRATPCGRCINRGNERKVKHLHSVFIPSSFHLHDDRAVA
jgi:hypothetical protein